MNTDKMTSDAVQDQFINELNIKLDYVLQQHTIVLNNDSTISQKNEILTGLARLQHLEDYTGVINTLESLEPDEEQLATILSDVCSLDVSTVMELVESFDPSILEVLKRYIYQKEAENETKVDADLKLIEGFKVFNEAIGKDNVGTKLLESGVISGQKFETYLPFAEDSIVVERNPDKTAENFLSLLILSIDGYNSPITVYRKYSYQILQNLNTVSDIEVRVLNLISKYSELKKALDEKNRLSSSGTQT